MKKLPLGMITHVLVDDADYAELRRYLWFHSGGYARRNLPPIPGKTQKVVTMHRQITKAGPGQIVDHIDGDGLNNQRSNLRVTNHAGNMKNRRKYKGQSKWKGVCPMKGCCGWIAQIRVPNSSGRPQKYLGYFQNELDAARAYDAAARKYFGSFAAVNFPLLGEQGVASSEEE